jgi:hypothetical protein
MLMVMMMMVLMMTMVMMRMVIMMMMIMRKKAPAERRQPREVTRSHSVPQQDTGSHRKSEEATVCRSKTQEATGSLLHLDVWPEPLVRLAVCSARSLNRKHSYAV